MAKGRAYRVTLAVVGIAFTLGCHSSEAQVANPDFEPDLPDPGSATARICIDEGHHNFHTLAGRYAPFVEVLRADGYLVTSVTGVSNAASLADCDVVVIANALAQVNVESWTLPNPSAFTTDEIAAIHAWVEGGGGLWLIADHMPFAGAAQQLGAAFGFELANGFAVRQGQTDVDVFTRDNGGLAAHPLVEGIEQIASFMGQAFRIPDHAQPILLLGPGYVSLEPTTAWEFLPDTPRRDVAGWAQAATLQVGSGRIAVFGEAAMLTSQVVGEGPPVGLDHPAAIGNTQLVRNVAMWLSAGAGG